MNGHLKRALSIAAGGVLTAAVVVRAWAATAQEVWQADVRVQSIDVSGARRGAQMTVHIAIASDNDDDARAARAEILLPVGVGVLRLPGGCKASPSTVPSLNARVTCELGDVPVRGLRELSIVTTGAAGTARMRFAVFVTSDTPDPEPSNNYAERAVP